MLAGQVDACRQIGDHAAVARGEAVLYGFDLRGLAEDAAKADEWVAAFVEANPAPDGVRQAELFG